MCRLDFHLREYLIEHLQTMGIVEVEELLIVFGRNGVGEESAIYLCLHDVCTIERFIYPDLTNDHFTRAVKLRQAQKAATPSEVLRESLGNAHTMIPIKEKEDE